MEAKQKLITISILLILYFFFLKDMLVGLLFTLFRKSINNSSYFSSIDLSFVVGYVPFLILLFFFFRYLSQYRAQKTTTPKSFPSKHSSIASTSTGLEKLFRRRSFWVGVILVATFIVSVIYYYSYPLESYLYEGYEGISSSSLFFRVLAQTFMMIPAAPLGLDSYITYLSSRNFSSYAWTFGSTPLSTPLVGPFLLLGVWGSFLLFFFYLPSLSRKTLIRASLIFLLLVLLIIIGCTTAPIPSL